MEAKFRFAQASKVDAISRIEYLADPARLRAGESQSPEELLAEIARLIPVHRAAEAVLADGAVYLRPETREAERAASWAALVAATKAVGIFFTLWAA